MVLTLQYDSCHVDCQPRQDARGNASCHAHETHVVSHSSDHENCHSKPEADCNCQDQVIYQLNVDAVMRPFQVLLNYYVAFKTYSYSSVVTLPLLYSPK